MSAEKDPTTTIYEDERPKWRAIIILALIALLVFSIAAIALVYALRIPQRSDRAIQEAAAIAPALRADKIETWRQVDLAITVAAWALPALAWLLVLGRATRLVQTIFPPRHEFRLLERPVKSEWPEIDAPRELHLGPPERDQLARRQVYHTTGENWKSGE